MRNQKKLNSIWITIRIRIILSLKISNLVVTRKQQKFVLSCRICANIVFLVFILSQMLVFYLLYYRKLHYIPWSMVELLMNFVSSVASKGSYHALDGIQKSSPVPKNVLKYHKKFSNYCPIIFGVNINDHWESHIQSFIYFVCFRSRKRTKSYLPPSHDIAVRIRTDPSP